MFTIQSFFYLSCECPSFVCKYILFRLKKIFQIFHTQQSYDKMLIDRVGQGSKGKYLAYSHYIQSVCHELEPNISPSGLPTLSLCKHFYPSNIPTYILLVYIHDMAENTHVKTENVQVNCISPDNYVLILKCYIWYHHLFLLTYMIQD